jgi:hypothetical protein
MCAALVATAAQADTVTSSASSLASESVGSLSDSVSGSSKASSGDDKKTAAAGTYRVTAVAAADGERLRLQLAPAQGQAEGFALTLPAAVAERQGLQPGATLYVAARAYGLAFAAQAGDAPFFLAVDDRLRRDFDSVKL